jgi:hypothetical protein
LINFFYPSVKLIHKTRRGARIQTRLLKLVRKKNMKIYYPGPTNTPRRLALGHTLYG